MNTNLPQEGRIRLAPYARNRSVNDVRFVKDSVARAPRALRAAKSPAPGDRFVALSAQMIGWRFTAATQAAGTDSRVTAHSGRVSGWRQN